MVGALRRSDPRELRIGSFGERGAPGGDRVLQLPRQAGAKAEGGGRRLALYTAIHNHTSPGQQVA